MDSNCPHLFLLSSIACQLSECLGREDLESLSADLIALGYMLEALMAHQPS